MFDCMHAVDMKCAKKVKWHDEEASIKSLNVHTVIDIFIKKRVSV